MLLWSLRWARLFRNGTGGGLVAQFSEVSFVLGALLSGRFPKRAAWDVAATVLEQEDIT